MVSKLVILIVAICVVAIDFVSKGVIVSSILPMTKFLNHYPYGGIGVFDNFWGIEFSIVHATNRGAAWSMLSDYQIYLVGFRIFLIFIVVFYAFFWSQRQSVTPAFGLIIGGAVANVIDYFRYGHVIDMFHFIFWGYDYPVFNVADSAIFIGICWIFLDTLKCSRSNLKSKT